ncbi:MAG: metallophosphoesterase [archaeon]
MKICIIGDPHGKVKASKSVLKKADLILLTGDIGKADLARKQAFERIRREREGLPELKPDKKQEKAGWIEIYNSTISILKNLTKFAQVYSILGNVGTSTDSQIKKEEKKLGIKLPYIRSGMNNVKNFNLVINNIRRINGLKIGFLDYFVDTCWIKEFRAKGEKYSGAKKETLKAKKILKRFNKVDILVCHQPPYGILDKVTWSKAPKHWKGKHAGSKVILDYIKKKQPRYVFCGHIHEGKGKKKIGKSEVYNVGVNGDYLLLDI